MSSDQSNHLSDLLSLRGRCALVTGASGGIGQGIASRLSEAGARVVLHYFSDAASADQLQQRISGSGGDAMVVCADLRSEEDVKRMFGEIHDNDRVVDCVVNNSGAYPAQMLPEMTGDEWRDVVAVNLDSAFLVTRRAVEEMCNNGTAGAIVNIASIDGSDPAPGRGHYASSKAGLLMQTKAFALECGAAGIRVNAVSPGLIDRDGLQEHWPEGVSSWLDNAPLRRMGTAADIANAVLFLLSPAAQWISGANLIVDGGMSVAPRW